MLATQEKSSSPSSHLFPREVPVIPTVFVELNMSVSVEIAAVVGEPHVVACISEVEGWSISRVGEHPLHHGRLEAMTKQDDGLTVRARILLCARDAVQLENITIIGDNSMRLSDEAILRCELLKR